MTANETERGFDPRLPFRTRSNRKLISLEPSGTYPGHYLVRLVPEPGERDVSHLFDGRGRHVKRLAAIDDQGTDAPHGVDGGLDIVNVADVDDPSGVAFGADLGAGIVVTVAAAIDIAGRVGFRATTRFLGMEVYADPGETMEMALARYDADCARVFEDRGPEGSKGSAETTASVPRALRQGLGRPIRRSLGRAA